MEEIHPAQFGTVLPLFRGIDHSVAIVHAVLEGNSPGRIFVDDAAHPRSALLFPAGTFFYVAGNETDGDFCQALSTLMFEQILPGASEKEMVLFAFSDAWRARLDELLKAKGAIRIHRKVFDFDAGLFHAYRKLGGKIPEGMRLSAIDPALAERYPAYQSLVDPASKRFGVCLMEGEQVVCECSAIYVGGGEAEIDIHTDERFQGKGYASLTAAAFLEACLARDLRPNWACWPERQASLALAKKLGFVEKPDVPAHLWAEDL